MDNEKNNSIKCSVNQCKYHMGTEEFCTLNSINVGACTSNPKDPECTKCDSFVSLQ